MVCRRIVNNGVKCGEYKLIRYWNTNNHEEVGYLLFDKDGRSTGMAFTEKQWEEFKKMIKKDGLNESKPCPTNESKTKSDGEWNNFAVGRYYLADDGRIYMVVRKRGKDMSVTPIKLYPATAVNPNEAIICTEDGEVFMCMAVDIPEGDQ